MRRLLPVIVGIALLAAGLSASWAQSRSLNGFGVVLLHGKGAAPGAFLGGLAEALRAEGAIVELPEMPWSHNRRYDATYDDAMNEIDAAVLKLRAAGAGKIVVAGHSLGANGAIGYAARREGLDAVIAMAPGHVPESGLLRLRAAGAIARAKKLIAAGQGDMPMSFPDMAQGIPLTVTATPKVYLSLFDPEGPAPMSKNAAAMPPVPFLWVVGIVDPIFLSGRDYAFTAGAKHPKSRYLQILANHLDTPFMARNKVVEWLKSL
jgi:pimeloyl-ACP methyl ester carboxylesterase